MTRRRRKASPWTLAALIITAAAGAGSAVLGNLLTSFLLGMAAGAAVMLSAARPRLSLRITARSSRPARGWPR